MTTLKHIAPVEVVVDDTGGYFTGWPSIVSCNSDITLVHRAGFKQNHWGELTQSQAVHIAKEIATLINAAPDRTSDQASSVEGMVDARAFDLLKKVFDHFKADNYSYNQDAPGHGHYKKGHWDKDGSPCKWCQTWEEVRDYINKEITERPQEPPQ